jgi:DNA invertase Pin-like site-specific DNA recombinase
MTTTKQLAEKHTCTHCKQIISKKRLLEMRQEKVRNIKFGIYKAKLEGKQLGRPKKSDYNHILNLRHQGLSIQKIADALKISRGSVQYALRGVK